MRNPKELIRMCEGRKVWIQTHNFPDPDAIASAFGLQQLLLQFDIESEVCHEGEIDKLSSVKLLNLCGIDMKPYSKVHGHMQETDMIVLVDCQKNNGNTEDFPGEEVAVIDHHPTYNWVEYEYEDLQITGACAGIIAEYYRELGIDPERKVATALLYGIKMDTLQFSRGVTAFDVEMFSYLLPFVNKKLLMELETNNMEFADLQAYGMAIQNVKVYGNVAFSYLSYPCPDALVATLSDFLLSLAEIEVVVLYSCRGGGYKFSIRSEREDIHAGDLANIALGTWGNGGGHAAMAGGYVPAESIPVESEMVFDAVQTRFISVIREIHPQILETAES